MKTDEICYVDTTFFHDKLDSKHYPFETDRYWLFTSKLCPFAHRTEIVRVLSGLSDDIGLTIAGSVQTAKGWNLDERYESSDSTRSPVDGIERLPAIYELSVQNYAGRASVPVLFDKKTNTIVNNESSEIIIQLDNLALRHFDRLSLYPADKRELIDELINELANNFVGPIYQAGFAKYQKTYHTNFKKVFNSLNKLEQHLTEFGPYIAGDQLTLADVHAFPHLSRFDAVFHSLYRLNLNYICDFPHISDYMGRLGEISAFADTLDIRALKEGYFISWNQPTNGHFVPEGPIVNPRTGIAITDQINRDYFSN